MHQSSPTLFLWMCLQHNVKNAGWHSFKKTVMSCHHTLSFFGNAITIVSDLNRKNNQSTMSSKCLIGIIITLKIKITIITTALLFTINIFAMKYEERIIIKELRPLNARNIDWYWVYIEVICNSLIMNKCLTISYDICNRTITYQYILVLVK